MNLAIFCGVAWLRMTSFAPQTIPQVMAIAFPARSLSTIIRSLGSDRFLNC
ncbi:hypothetical protein NC990_08150 [Funiculus sociatus GB2-M1]